MSRKHKSRKGKKHGNRPPKQQVVVPQRKIVTLEELLNRVHAKEDLSTTCLRQCTCCRVACPQMKFCEASSIIDHVFLTWSKEDKKKLLVTAVKYYFSDSLIKPCPLLDGQRCRVYDRRPLNCRLYGLWPSDDWEKRVEGFSKSTGLPREKLPLNTQCPNVKRKKQKCKYCCGNGEVENPSTFTLENCPACEGRGEFQPSPLTSDQIRAMFADLDKVDTTLGVSDLKIGTSWNYRTFHDWVLLKFWGESVLVKWTNIILTTTPEQRDGILAAFEEQVDKIITS